MYGCPIKLALVFIVSLMLAACSGGDGHNPLLDPPPVTPAAAASSIDFDGLTSSIISIKGTGETGNTPGTQNRPEMAIVKFIVRDINGNPLAGQTVDFSLSNVDGGIDLNISQDTSDSDGLVQTSVNGGSIQTSVRVKASFTPVGGTEISTLSNVLVISTGLPDQDSFGFINITKNPEAFNIDGSRVGLEVILGDHFNNPVPDGTPVNFLTNGGLIDASCLTTNSRCIAQWTSAPPHPADGRVTILATTVGEESFHDTNSNGRFDDGELAIKDDLPEAFIDTDSNNSFGTGTEVFRDFDGNRQYDTPSGFFNGSLCTDAAIALGHCASLIHVRAHAHLVMSTSPANIAFSDGSGAVVSDVDISGAGTASVIITIADLNGNAPPFNSDVLITASAGKLDRRGDFKVPSQLGPFDVAIGMLSNNPSSIETGFLTVTVTSPSGVVSIARIGVTDGP